jgi:hypothetical protein
MHLARVEICICSENITLGVSPWKWRSRQYDRLCSRVSSHPRERC